MKNINDPKEKNDEAQDSQPQPAVQLPLNEALINEAEIEEEDIDEEEDMNWDEGNDDMDDYGSSTEKYGGYNGYSDDVIDDAFEGDPENTWNVD